MCVGRRAGTSVGGGRLLGRFLEAEQLLPPDVRRAGRAPVAVVGAELVAQRHGPAAAGAVRGLTERQEAALGEELVGGHHRVAADRELEVRVPRRAPTRGLRRRRLDREVAGEGHPRRHEGRRRRLVVLRVVHVNTCHASARTSALAPHLTSPLLSYSLSLSLSLCPPTRALAPVRESS
uniref:Uncharacterized protein n=1 Tax=Arundo donax TaxID=35708 RepID=A0A0A8XR30_ARUDO